MQEGIRFADPTWLLGLWALPVIAGVLALAIAGRRAALRRFIDASLLPAMNRRASTVRAVVRAVLVVMACGCAVFAMARPQWGERTVEIQRQGRDVAFVVDVSRSMLADDLAPNRLERSKLWMNDVVRTLQGDRVGLVAFAGHAVARCPLTIDYGFFKMATDELSPRNVSRGGTMIGDAIRTAIDEVFTLADDEQLDPETRYRDIILITDGEDQGSFPVEAAEVAGELGIRLIIIGIGSEDGTTLRIRDDRGRSRTVRDADGNPVVTRLDAETLSQMARATPGGVYFNVADGTIELDEVYRRLVQQSEQNASELAEMTTYQERYQWILLIAVALLIVESCIGERRSA
jgi:Ca-activated chloride channel family protein